MAKKIKWPKIFFGKKEKSIEDKVQELKKLMPVILEEFKGFIPTNNGINLDFSDDPNALTDVSKNEITQTLYDWLLGYRNSFSNNFDDMNPSFDKSMQSKDTRIVAKPKDIVAELERVPNPIDCQDLDNKINLFLDKSSLAKQRYVKEEIDAFIVRLENRKNFVEYAEFYNQFPYTTDDRIDLLVSKYQLKNDRVELFIPALPKEAIKVMKDYKKTTLKATGKEPVFYVIAEESDFKDLNKRLDPILLVQSPFGFVWQILGAWDKEMLLLQEL